MKSSARLSPGMLIRTNYSGPYRIESIRRDCTCPVFWDEFHNGASAKAGRAHIHLTCSAPDRPGSHYWLNRWDEDSLESLDATYCGMKHEPAPDWIEVLTAAAAPVGFSQLDLFAAVAG